METKEIYEKITCPGKRKHSRNTKKGVYPKSVCGRSVIFIPRQADMEEVILPPCGSCGTIVGVSQRDSEITIRVYSKELRVKSIQTLRKICYGHGTE